MMASSARRLLAAAALSVSFFVSQAQPARNEPVKKETRPYKVVASGRQLTIKSKKSIQHIMLWTSGGHRVVEQRDINVTTYNFTIPVNEKIFFMMVGLEGGKIYTEKIGVH